METLFSFFFAFNIPNLIEGDFVLAMSWDASAINTNNSVNEIDSYELERCIYYLQMLRIQK